MSFLRNQSKQGTKPAFMAAFKRSLLLVVVAAFVYHFDPRRIFWDALTQIGFGSLLALPVIGAGTSFRVLLPFAYAGVLLAIGKVRLLGVPFELESASWPLMILMGSIAGDWLLEGPRALTRKALLSGVILLCLGLGVYLLAPSRVAACALIYLGLSFLIFDLFHHLVDVWKMPLPHLTTLGRNALVVYILHYYIDDDMRRLVPNDVGAVPAILVFAVVYVGCYSVAKYLQDRKYFVTV